MQHKMANIYNLVILHLVTTNIQCIVRSKERPWTKYKQWDQVDRGGVEFSPCVLQKSNNVPQQWTK